MAKYDPDQIISDNNIVDVIKGYLSLKPNGNEYEACCPFHEEKTPSFSVAPDKGFYHCFGCGAHGDQIDFIREYEQVDFVGACKILGGEESEGKSKPKSRRSKKADVPDVYEGIEVISPVPDDAQVLLKGKSTCKIFNPKRADDPKKKFTTYKPSMVFPYHDEQGALLGYVLRIDFGDNKKITPTITWCKLPDGTHSWTHCGFPEPKPLYGAQDFVDNKPVLICEGEKARDAAKTILGKDYICVSWNGGTQQVSKTDWSKLKGRRILIWCDNDQPGVDAAIGKESKKGIAQYLTEVGVESIKYIGLDSKKKKGWDAADAVAEGMTRNAVVHWAKKHIQEYKEEQESESPPMPEEEPYDITTVEYQDDHADDQPETNNTDFPYRILGFNRGLFYYLPDRSQQLISLTASQHTVNNLFSIAPCSHWEIEYPDKKGFDLNMAVNAMIGRSYNQGLFDPHELLRGRGAWLDDNRAVLHLGSKCFVDGVETPPRSVSSKYIYEHQTDLSITINKPATNKESHMLPEMCSQLSWENPLSAAMLSGWCVIAPVCGILKWRPHIWITGPSGSGKTTVIKDVIGRIVGDMALHMEGKTTEAGIRQQLCQDARPIVFDEAEAEDESSARRMQSILDLARVASSGGKIIKGTQSGTGVSFSVRSCFCFSSINTSVQHFADESRINKLILKKDNSEDAKDKYDGIDKVIKETFTPEYSAAMLARSIKYLPILQKNCSTFIDAATRVFGSRRLADQMGTLLAGYYLCFSVKEISSAEAEKWMNEQEWTEYTDITNRQDEQRLLEYIATRRIRVEDDKGFHDVNVGELILSATKEIDIVQQVAADRELRRHGIIADFQTVLIANNCQPMKELLKGTAWSSDWARPLKDLYDASTTKVKYFAPGIKSRAVELPLSLFKED